MPSVSASPWWVLGTACLLTSPIGMVLVAAVLERRQLRPSEQYVSFFYGDIALGLAALVAGHAFVSDAVAPGFATTGWWLLVSLVAAVAGGLATWWIDLRARVTSGPRSGELVYTRGQLLSPTKVFHNTVCWWVLGTVTVGSTLPFLIAGSAAGASQVLAKALVLACLLFWVGAVVWDGSHEKPAAHVEARHWWWR